MWRGPPLEVGGMPRGGHKDHRVLYRAAPTLHRLVYRPLSRCWLKRQALKLIAGLHRIQRRLCGRPHAVHVPLSAGIHRPKPAPDAGANNLLKPSTKAWRSPHQDMVPSYLPNDAFVKMSMAPDALSRLQRGSDGYDEARSDCTAY
jgi:hypothetical protein